MTTGRPLESWTAGEPYERYMGRWSRKVAPPFLAWLAVGAEARWGDVGCGTGALIETILRQQGPAAVAGVDRSAAYVAHARTRLRGAPVGLAIALRSEVASFDQGERFPLCQPEPLKILMTRAGLQAVEVCAIDIDMLFRSFDDYWKPFLGGQGAAPSYVVALEAHARQQLREALRQRLPAAPDGSICLQARAWAVKSIPLGW